MSTRIIRGIAGLALAVGIGVLWTPTPANANMRMELFDNGNGVGIVLTDTANTGHFTFDGVVGNFVINVTTGSSQPPGGLPPGEIASLDLNSINAVSPAGGTLTIILENAGYSGNGALPPFTDNSRVGGTLTPGGSLTATSAVYPNNNPPTLPPDGSTTTAPPPLGGTTVLNFHTVSSSYSASNSVNFTPTAALGQFALAKEFVITVGPNGQFSANFANDVTVPELDPGSMASGLTLVSGSLLMLFGRRRQARA
jgi:hypothetical protein